MALFNVTNTLKAVETYLRKDGACGAVTIGEPKSPPGGGKYQAAVYMRSTAVYGVTANGGTLEVHVVNVRLYKDMLAEPRENIETDLATALARIASDLIGEYDLGATVRNIDVAGAQGTPMSSEWGYTSISEKMFRVIDLRVPLLVDDSATAAA